MSSRALYLFVREGVSKDIAPQPRGLSAGGGPVVVPSPDPDEAKIVIGGEGGQKVFPYWMFQSVNVTTVKVMVETKRETSVERVENPDDKSQYVNVEKIDKLDTKNKDNPKEKTTIEFQNKTTKLKYESS